MKRFQSRQGNGRFRRNTLANTFGLRAPVCPKCRTFNPHGVGQPAPTHCHACGAFIGQPMPWWYTLTAIMLLEGMRRQLGDLEKAQKVVLNLTAQYPVCPEVRTCLSLPR